MYCSKSAFVKFHALPAYKYNYRNSYGINTVESLGIQLTFSTAAKIFQIEIFSERKLMALIALEGVSFILFFLFLVELPLCAQLMTVDGNS